MYRIKKITLFLLTFIFIILTIIELIKYLLNNATLFGLIYLLCNLLIIFLLIPCSYNYKKYFSKERISKLIIIVLLGIFTSYILQGIVLETMNYNDESIKYIKSIFLYKNVLKGIIYFIIAVITIFEFRVEKLLKKVLVKKVD